MEIIKDSARSNKRALRGIPTDDMDKAEKYTQQEEDRKEHIITRHRHGKPMYITD